jgi:hypothetical protein
MTNNSMKSSSLQSEAEATVPLINDWVDPIEAGLRHRVREFIQAMIESELEAVLVRLRYGRCPTAEGENADGASGISGYRHGHRSRSLMGPLAGSRHRAGGQAQHRGRRDNRVEEFGLAGLPAMKNLARSVWSRESRTSRDRLSLSTPNSRAAGMLIGSRQRGKADA